jgi:hypothetical protein
MTDCLRIVENQIFGNVHFDSNSPAYHPKLDRATIGPYKLFLAKEKTTAGPGRLRNHPVTYLVNFHNEVYPNDDFQICNGPYVVYGFNENDGTILDHNELEALAQFIRMRMDTAIQNNLYSIGIPDVAGKLIKQTLY